MDGIPKWWLGFLLLSCVEAKFPMEEEWEEFHLFDEFVDVYELEVCLHVYVCVCVCGKWGREPKGRKGKGKFELLNGIVDDQGIGKNVLYVCICDWVYVCVEAVDTKGKREGNVKGDLMDFGCVVYMENRIKLICIKCMERKLNVLNMYKECVEKWICFYVFAMHVIVALKW